MTDYCHSWGKSEKIVSSKEDQNTTKDKWKIGEGKVWGAHCIMSEFVVTSLVYF